MGQPKTPLPDQEAADQEEQAPRLRLASTRNIIDKNLFDPERGASKTRETEAVSAAMQRVRGMILVGTAILGEGRYAILTDPSPSRSPAPRGAGQATQLRLRLGDTVEGFKLSEIEAKEVVFTNGLSRVNLALDYGRKFDELPGQRAPVTATPGARSVESSGAESAARAPDKAGVGGIDPSGPGRAEAVAPRPQAKSPEVTAANQRPKVERAPRPHKSLRPAISRPDRKAPDAETASP